MKLSDLEKYDHIVIQAHNDPDADAVGSGYALYCYFKSLGKDVSFIYGGRNEISKSNMKLMLSELDIPIKYVTELDKPELLLTVDCQYGEGNVQKFDAHNVAMIDHHSTGKQSDSMAEIRSHLVSCSTIVYSMLKDEGFDANSNTEIATALYYGLYMDSNQLSEISHPLDRDMIDFLHYDKQLVTRLKYANFNISELETAGFAISNNIYLEEQRAAIVRSEPCDPNILGVIGDFVIQVDSIDVCIIFNETQGGYKFSVRSCALDIAANELAAFLATDIGSGGGHLVKAGGFISRIKFEDRYKDTTPEQHFTDRINEYCNGYDIVRYTDDVDDISTFRRYRKLPGEYGYIRTTDLFPAGTECKIRTLEGDVFITTDEDIYIMIGYMGEVYPVEKKVFETKYTDTGMPFAGKYEYTPSIINIVDGNQYDLMPYAKKCTTEAGSVIYARPLAKFTKVFTRWDYEGYMSGAKDDLLCYIENDLHDVYIVKKDIFRLIYEDI